MSARPIGDQKRSDPRCEIAFVCPRTAVLPVAVADCLIDRDNPTTPLRRCNVYVAAAVAAGRVLSKLQRRRLGVANSGREALQGKASAILCQWRRLSR